MDTKQVLDTQGSLLIRGENGWEDIKMNVERLLKEVADRIVDVIVTMNIVYVVRS